MARSSGGGGGGGGGSSRSSYSSSSHSSDHWRDHSGGGHSISSAKVRRHHFHGATRYSYRRRGRKRYVYSNRDLTQCQDANPLAHIAKLLLYVFLALFVSAYLAAEVPKFNSPTNDAIKITDQIDCFTDEEEAQLLETMAAFKSSTGINTVIYTTRLTTRFDIDEFTMNEYYRQYNHENGWVIVYAETKETPIAWQWEGVQGDNTTITMNYFLNSFNKTVQKSLESDGLSPDPYKAFDSAFTKATTKFDSQQDGLNTEVFRIWAFILVPFAIIASEPWKIRFYGFKCKNLEKDPEWDDEQKEV